MLGPTATSRPEDRSALQPWARCWYAWVGSAFLRAWVAVVGPTPVLPRDIEARQILLDAYLIETALTELVDASRYRPERAGNPFRGILDMVQAE